MEKQRDSGHCMLGLYSSSAKWRNWPGLKLYFPDKDENLTWYSPGAGLIKSVTMLLYFLTIAIFMDHKVTQRAHRVTPSIFTMLLKGLVVLFRLLMIWYRSSTAIQAYSRIISCMSRFGLCARH